MLDESDLTLQLLDLATLAAVGLASAQGDPRTVNLREAGLTSIAAVRLMLEIEAAFSLAIPDEDLTPENFADLASIERLIHRLKSSAQA